MSQWGRIKLNLDAGNQFTDVAASAAPGESEGPLRTHLGLSAGGQFDFSFVKFGTSDKTAVVELRQFTFDLGDATTWDLQLKTSAEGGDLLITILSEADFIAVPNMRVWVPQEPVVIDQGNGDQLVLVTTGATTVLFAEAVVSGW